MANKADIEEHKRAFLIHLLFYIAANAVLVTINLLSNPETVWFIWPLIGWGIAVAAHALTVYLEIKSTKSGLLSSADARSFVSHLFVYLSVMLLLAVINLRSAPDEIWFHWPLLGWGLGVFLHGLTIRSASKNTGVAAPQPGAKPRRSKQTSTPAAATSTG